MPSYHVWTMGCQMNKADSNYIAAALERAGYTPTPAIGEADFIVLNTCVVRQGAEDKAINKIYSLRPIKKARPEVKVVVTGCLSSSGDEALKRRFPYVDFFLPPLEPGDFRREALAGLLPQDEPETPAAAGITAYLPIIRGCNNFCTYCIVPQRRGREKSRLPGDIIAEARQLVQNGAREITLLGQNVDSYGHDLDGRPGLAALLRELNDVPGLARIRFLTNHPKDMGPELVAAIAGLDKVCEHVNLPVQAGDDAVLKMMGRGYTAADYARLVRSIRAAAPGIAISTDMIIGFPGESEAQFEHSMSLLEEIRFDVVHLAAYSPRPGTAAARLVDDVPAAEKKRRLNLAEELQQRIGAEINAALLEREVEVLVEGKKNGKWHGRTRTDKLAFFKDRDDWLGQLVRVRVEKTSAWALQGAVAR